MSRRKTAKVEDALVALARLDVPLAQLRVVETRDGERFLAVEADGFMSGWCDGPDELAVAALARLLPRAGVPVIGTSGAGARGTFPEGADDDAVQRLLWVASRAGVGADDAARALRSVVAAPVGSEVVALFAARFGLDPSAARSLLGT